MEQIQTEMALNALGALEEALSTLKQNEYGDKLNFFSATGMSRQEIKHSAFFAWLLHPKSPHGLKNRALKLFCEKLFCYRTARSDVSELKSNSEILKGIDLSMEEFCALVQAENISVETEVATDEDRRIDILIDVPATKTVIVIENKTFTQSHDDQLCAYEKYADEIGFTDYQHKIFVYLSPRGEIPYNFGGDAKYNGRWCIFDYRGILDICREIVKELPRTSEGKKLKLILEDYIEMVNTNILQNNPTLREKCKKILREHRDALEILMNYTDNAQEVVEYSVKWLQMNVAGMRIHKQTKFLLEFCTDSVEQCFQKYGEGIYTNGNRLKLRYSISCADGPIMISVCLEKDRDTEWSATQMKIRDLLLSGRPMGGLYCSKTIDTLLLAEKREGKLDENLQAEIEGKLQSFVRELHRQEAQLLSL